MKITLVLFFVAFATTAQGAEVTVSAGEFHGGKHAPSDTASGLVTLVKLDSGEYELRLGDNFKTTPGPDLFVYLSAAVDPRNDAAITGNAFVDAGKLASPLGKQNLSLPMDVDPKKFKSVAIWCKKFSVLFGAAALKTN